MADLLPIPPETAPVAPPVAGGPAITASATAAASPAARITAPLFGGLRGGRKRKDGLVPGSSQAIEADREKDRLRKENQRKREQAAADPTALPTAGLANESSPAPGAVAGNLDTEGIPPLPWDAKMLAPLFEQLVPTIEELTVNQIASRAAKARIPADIIREIEVDAKWSKPAKKAIELSAPQVAAKWLNKTGISAENQAEVILFTAISSILASHVMLVRRLDQLAAAVNVPVKPAASPPEKPKI